MRWIWARNGVGKGTKGEEGNSKKRSWTEMWNRPQCGFASAISSTRAAFFLGVRFAARLPGLSGSFPGAGTAQRRADDAEVFLSASPKDLETSRCQKMQSRSAIV